eukprot:CAMPEP_0177628946 /NCGR_PEP_ID=MMETSP0447-20121125/401_1 /TAXON_ID=0 /ORGANISM="Stygamoeba regulata, Strain BSH-02190019" /LENGTH=348 /DNA_ID=CAMNT_0019130225 /DNA_START=95 /DNA_END=1141 /DNA_ORIENTATION=-
MQSRRSASALTEKNVEDHPHKTSPGAVKRTITLFGVNLSALPTPLALAIAITLSFSSQILYSTLQEQVFKVEKFPYYWLHTLLQCLFYTTLAMVGTQTGPGFRKRSREELLLFVSIGFCLIGNRALGNLSFYYIDYTTKTLFQSSKILPVMFLGVLLLKKRYTSIQYLISSLLILGLFLFSSADAHSSESFRIEGVFLMGIVLFSDAGKSILQERAMKTNCQTTVSFFGNIIASGLAIPFVVAYGQLVPGIAHLWEHPRLVGLIVLLFISGYIGQISMLTVIRLSDAFTGTMVSSARKLATVILSFLLFGKPCATRHLIGGGVFFSGVALNIYLKRSKHKKTTAAVNS